MKNFSIIFYNYEEGNLNHSISLSDYIIGIGKSEFNEVEFDVINKFISELSDNSWYEFPAFSYLDDDCMLDNVPEIIIINKTPKIRDLNISFKGSYELIYMLLPDFLRTLVNYKLVDEPLPVSIKLYEYKNFIGDFIYSPFTYRLGSTNYYEFNIEDPSILSFEELGKSFSILYNGGELYCMYKDAALLKRGYNKFTNELRRLVENYV